MSKKLRISRHVIFWEHVMFSSLSKFTVSPTDSPPLFTNPFIELFLHDAGTHVEHIDVEPPSTPITDDAHFADTGHQRPLMIPLRAILLE